MMREHALAGLNTQLDAAVTNGDTEAARKITADIAKLAVTNAPKAPPYGDAEIRTELNKLDWFGVDPKKSGLAIALGKDMNIHKFASAVEFAAALVKAVEAEGKPVTAVKAKADDDNETDEEREEREAEEAEAAEATAAAKAKRKTDGPGEGDAGGRAAARRTSGPWTKLTDAPGDVQKEIKRSADKFVSANAPKEQREKFISKALESHYATHQRSKGKK
jgi:hypothetical protein